MNVLSRVHEAVVFISNPLEPLMNVYINNESGLISCLYSHVVVLKVHMDLVCFSL